jgi:branched-subunit amino acid ABC-type transport system permease component
MTHFLQFVANGVVAGSTFGLLAASFALIVSVTRRFHIAYIATFAVGAYGAVWAQSGLHLSIGLCVVVGMAAGALLGVLIEGGIYSQVALRASRRGADPLVPILVVALGATTVVQVTIGMIAGSGFRPLSLIQIQPLRIGGVYLTNFDLVTTGVCWVLVGTLAAWLRYTQHGRTIRGVRANPAMARAVGINVASVHRWVFVVASALAAVLGMLSAGQSGATPGMGFNEVFDAFVVAFVAGTERGPIVIAIAGLVIAEIQSVSAVWIGTQWEPLVVFGVLILYLSVKPWGPVWNRPLRALLSFRS